MFSYRCPEDAKYCSSCWWNQTQQQILKIMKWKLIEDIQWKHFTKMSSVTTSSCRNYMNIKFILKYEIWMLLFIVMWCNFLGMMLLVHATQTDLSASVGGVMLQCCTRHLHTFKCYNIAIDVTRYIYCPPAHQSVSPYHANSLNQTH